MHSNFDEVNLRFYVRRQTGGEVRRGVVFIREMVPRRAIAFVARTFYNENYVALPMAHEIRSVAGNRLKVAYRWKSENRWSGISLETDGNSELPARAPPRGECGRCGSRRLRATRESSTEMILQRRSGENPSQLYLQKG